MEAMGAMEAINLCTLNLKIKIKLKKVNMEVIISLSLINMCLRFHITLLP